MSLTIEDLASQSPKNFNKRVESKNILQEEEKKEQINDSDSSSSDSEFEISPSLRLNNFRTNTFLMNTNQNINLHTRDASNDSDFSPPPRSNNSRHTIIITRNDDSSSDSDTPAPKINITRRSVIQPLDSSSDDDSDEDDCIPVRRNTAISSRNNFNKKIEDLTVSTYLIGDDGENEKCMICLDDFVKNEKINQLKCFHKYHINCIKKWLKIQNFCPLCKKKAV